MLDHLYKYPAEVISSFVTILPIVVMTFRMDYKNRLLGHVFVFLVAKFIIEVSMVYMAAFKMNNLALYNTYVLSSYLILAKAFYVAFEFDSDKKIVRYTSIFFILVFCLDWYHQGIDRSVKVSATLECVLIIAFVLRYFWEITTLLKIPNLLTFPFFWAACGILCYFCSLTFVTPLYNILDRWGTTHEFDFIYMIPCIVDAMYLSIFSFVLLKLE